ncbi:MAG: hypothetical protein K5924_11605 [Chloroflexi bacterium]|nr:hypothetical protein [Chloroflexota bacterium]
MNRRPILALTLILALSACGLGIGTTAPPGGDGGSSGRLTIIDADADGPAIGVADALRISSDLPVRVSGSLFVGENGRVLLCSAIAESFPPQCAGERIEVLALDLSNLELQAAGDVRWAEAVELVGTVGS